MHNKWLKYRRLFKYSSWFLDLIELFFLRKYGNLKNNLPTIYIVGPPRSGSTVLYQLITNYLDVLYIDNLTDAARNNLFIGILLSQKRFKNINHESFRSSYGDTKSEGLHAPSEGLFWYKYFPKDRHYIRSIDISEENKNKLLKYHNAIKNKFKKPFVIKNLSFAMRLELIAEMEPDAKIIFVNRDLTDTIKSVYSARKKLNWPDHKIWSIKPQNYKQLESLPVLKQITFQVMDIISQIRKDGSLFKSNFLEIQYEELLKNPTAELKKISQLIGIKNSKTMEIRPLIKPLSNAMNDEIIAEIREHINNYHTIA